METGGKVEMHVGTSVPDGTEVTSRWGLTAAGWGRRGTGQSRDRGGNRWGLKREWAGSEFDRWDGVNYKRPLSQTQPYPYTGAGGEKVWECCQAQVQLIKSHRYQAGVIPWSYTNRKVYTTLQTTLSSQHTHTALEPSCIWNSVLPSDTQSLSITYPGHDA